MLAQTLYSSSEISRIDIQRVLRPSVAYSSRCCKVCSVKGFSPLKRSKITVSAPLQYNFIFPSGLRTTVDIRLRVLLHSQIFKISYSLSCPSTTIVTDFGRRV